MNVAGKSALFVIPKYAVILGVVAFLVVNFWGLYSMPMDEHGKMTNCPFTNNSASLCHMSFIQHIAQWQLLFTATHGKNWFFSILTLLAALLIITFLSLVPKARDKLLPQRFHDYLYKHKPEVKLFNNLVLVFSQGILNPRIYA